MRYWLLIFGLIFPSFLLAQQLVHTYYDTKGKPLKEEYRVNANGELNGKYASFYENGNLKSTGFFIRNKSSNEWVYYYSSGEIRMKGNVVDGQNEGVWQYFYEVGGKKMQGELVQGKRTGLWVIYSASGAKQSEGQFDGNTKVGIWKYYDESAGIKATEEISDDHSIYTEFYNSGEKKATGNTIDSNKTGEWLYFYKDGSLQAKGNYRDGKKFGNWKYYNKLGSLKAEGNYINDLADGVWIYYNEAGGVESNGELYRGKKNGAWNLYYSDGSIKGEANYILGNGEYSEYYKSGSLKIKGEIVNGQNHGIWQYFYESGFVEGECNFRNGEGEFLGYYPPKGKKRIREAVLGSRKMKGTISENRKIGIWELYEPDGALAGYYKPYYEGENERFLLANDSNEQKVLSAQKRQVEIGSYAYHSNKIKYFNSKINEHRAYIIDYNPAAVFYNEFPLGIEYYMEERLGYEFLVQYLRNPFLKNFTTLDNGIVYSQGFAASIRQKFYQRSTNFGIPYFAHELRYTYMEHLTNVSNVSTLGAIESKYEYALILGVRYFKYERNSGFTADVFLGAAAGYRDYKQKLENPLILITTINNNILSLSFRVGFHLGYSFKTRKF